MKNSQVPVGDFSPHQLNGPIKQASGMISISDYGSVYAGFIELFFSRWLLFLAQFSQDKFCSLSTYLLV